MRPLSITVLNIAAALILRLTNVAIAEPPSATLVPSADSATAAAQRPKPAVRVTISKETTWITAPLREDGYPDYLRYLNEKMAEGVTRENNAIVPLAHLTGFFELEGDTRKEYFKLLGIDPPPEKGDYFERWETFAARIAETEQPPVPNGDKRTQREYFEKLVDVAGARAWTRNEFPHIAKWLAENERHLDAIVAASKLPRAYSPLVIAPDETFAYPMLLAASMLHVDVCRNAAEAVRCRAMLRAANGDTSLAIDDLMAAQRLAVLVSKTPNLTCFLVAKEIECKTTDAAVQFSAQAGLTREQIAHFKKNWRSFPTSETLVPAYDLDARLEHLDATCYLAREGWHTLQDLTTYIVESSAGDDEPKRDRKPKWSRTFTAIVTRLIRWNEPLKFANEWYDRLVHIVQISDRDLQNAELDEFDEDLHELENEALRKPTKTGILFYPRRIPTAMTSKILVGLLLPPIHAVLNAAHDLETHRTMFAVGVGLAQFRVDHNYYPVSLKDLVPRYLASTPVDDFTSSKLQYRRTDRGYVLYSLGQNGQDDGGKTADEDEHSDDVVVVVPSKK